MAWWQEHRRAGTVSWSMVSLVVTLAAALVLGLSVHLPVWLRTDVGIVQVPPGMLTVDDVAHGTVTFGDGYTVSVLASGLRIARYDDVLLDTVTKGSFVTALTGSVAKDGTSGHEETVTRSASNLHVTSLVLDRGTAVWSAVVYGPAGEQDLTHRVRVQAARDGSTMRVTVSVRGADGIVVHLDPRSATTGVPPALPERNLRKRGWWAATTTPALFTNVLGVRVGLEAGKAPRALDLRPDGVLDLHAWTSSVVITATQVRRPAVAHS